MLTSVGVSDVLRERLELLKEQVQTLQREAEQSKAAYETLLNEHAELQKKHAEAVVPEDFVKHCNVLFRRLGDGRYDETSVFCPRCKLAMLSDHRVFAFRCANCKYAVDWGRPRLPSVIESLKGLS